MRHRSQRQSGAHVGPLSGRGKLGAGVPKLCGADVELGNFILGLERRDGTGDEAARALLREVDGIPHLQAAGYGYSYGQGVASYPAYGSASACGAFETWGSGGASGYDPQDWGRKFLASNGGCAYIDLDHQEICLPEVLSAFDHVAAWHAMLRIVRHAQIAANAKLPAGQKIQVLVNNSDGCSNSYGGHLNFLITRRAFENIFNRKLHYQLFLASFQVASIILGQGKVGAENGAPPVAYQLSQRADFFEALTGTQTTYHRPVVNARDESLCGSAGAVKTGENGDLARLHCIFFDSTLCHVASVLKVGLMQIVLAMIEAEQVDLRLVLEDPVDAVVCWSHDPTLRARSRLVSGLDVNIVELQALFFEAAKQFADAGGCDGIVPRADEILRLWQDTLAKLEERDLSALAPRLDWVLKLQTIRRALEQRPDLNWASPEIKHLDHLYSSLDPGEGLYWAYEAGGAVERVVSEEQIERFVQHPPEDTRAWTRTLLLRLAGRERVVAVDWDAVTFATASDSYWPRYRRVDLADPLAFTRKQMEARVRATRTLEELLDVLDAVDVSPAATTGAQWLAPARRWDTAAGVVGWRSKGNGGDY